MRDSRRLRTKTSLLAAAVILSNVSGNFALSVGMRDSHVAASVSMASMLGAVFNLWIAAGVGLLAVWMLSQLSLLSCADLSYVLPVTAVSYVLTALLGALVLHEYVSTIHWIGITMIVLGVTLVGRTSPQTVPVHPAEFGE